MDKHLSLFFAHQNALIFFTNKSNSFDACLLKCPKFANKKDCNFRSNDKYNERMQNLVHFIELS